MKTIGYKIIALDYDTPAPPTRVYKTFRGAEAAKKRLGSHYIVESVTNMPFPGLNDAAGWDAYRLAHGIAAR